MTLSEQHTPYLNIYEQFGNKQNAFYIKFAPLAALSDIKDKKMKKSAR
jgi:hypothetical protein